MNKVYPILLLQILLINFYASAQEWKSLGTDELFEKAREQAFNGNRELSREMLSFILQNSPDYHDVRILLGRTYAWDGKYEDARKELQAVLSRWPENLDAFNALTDCEMWSEQFYAALEVADRGLKIFPNDEDLLYKRASILNNLKKQEEAVITLNKLLTINPSHEKGNSLLKAIEIAGMKYTAGVSYSVDLFDRTFDPAHYGALQLGRTNSWGSSIVRLNWAHRFETDGWQPEIDLYPRIANGIYAYLNYGYSDTDLFPEHRIGGEIFTKLPASFEASAGMRYLYFDGDTKVNIYTGSIGWYVKDYWLSLRPFIIPDEETGTSVSASLSVRKFFSDADTYFGLSGGLGFSPDFRRIQSSAGLAADEIYLLRSQRVGVVFQKLLRPDFTMNFSVDLNRQELIFDEGEYVLITGIGVSARKRF